MDIWAISEEQIYEELGTSPKGLTEDEAFARLQKHGHNSLPAKVGRPIIFKLFDQFTTLFAIMLEAAADRVAQERLVQGTWPIERQLQQRRIAIECLHPVLELAGDRVGLHQRALPARIVLELHDRRR